MTAKQLQDLVSHCCEPFQGCRGQALFFIIAEEVRVGAGIQVAGFVVPFFIHGIIPLILTVMVFGFSALLGRLLYWRRAVRGGSRWQLGRLVLAALDEGYRYARRQQARRHARCDRDP